MSSITANSPSPHFKFPCPSSNPSSSSHQEESTDYFALDASKFRLDPSSQGEHDVSIQLQQQQQQHSEPLISQGTIYEETEEDEEKSNGHSYFVQRQQRYNPSSRKTHNKFDSSSSIKTNGSEVTLVDPLSYQRPNGLALSTSCDTLYDFTALSPMMKPPSHLKSNVFSSPIANINKVPSSATEQTFHARASLSSPHLTPTRPMIRHSLSLSQDSSRFNNTRINKDMIHQIPLDTSFISGDELLKYMSHSKFDRSTGLSNLIIIDVRPFGEYCKNHIKHSINICLSSTLLKRTSFDLKRCVDSLPACDKLLFSAHFANSQHQNQNQNQQEQSLVFSSGIPQSANGFPVVVLYDTCTMMDNKASSSLSYTASKFINDKDWDSPVFLLKGGFQEFASKYPNHLSNFDDFNTDSDTTPNLHSAAHPQFVNNSLFSSSSPDSSPASSIHSVSSLPLLPPRPSVFIKLTSSPILARFVLPSPSNAVFKMRHNEELLTSRPDETLSLHESDLTTLEQHNLPKWILSTIGNDKGCSSIADKFSYLEKVERSRLNRVFSTRSNFNNQFTDATLEDDPDHPQISSGVELGDKNRYKDILPYEHSRVKLTKETGCDYINASYISPKHSKNKYIATQGPLQATIGDFWSLVVSHRSPLILSLTAQNEGGVEKCAPFWESGIYKESSNTIKVEILEQDDHFKINSNSESPMILRRLKITINDSLEHEILQIQVLSWPDYDASIAKRDLISLVALKKSILKFSNYENSPIIVHCSAGCGRTGTFCAIDSTIDLLLSNDKDGLNEEDDPILTTVDCFRRQRISMVQTVRQYLLIYDTVLLFLKGQLNSSNNDNWDIRLDNSIEQDSLKRDGNGENIDILIHFIQDLRSSHT